MPVTVPFYSPKLPISSGGRIVQTDESQTALGGLAGAIATAIEGYASGKKQRKEDQRQARQDKLEKKKAKAYYEATMARAKQAKDIDPDAASRILFKMGELYAIKDQYPENKGIDEVIARGEAMLDKFGLKAEKPPTGMPTQIQQPQQSHQSQSSETQGLLTNNVALRPLTKVLSSMVSGQAQQQAPSEPQLTGRKVKVLSPDGEEGWIDEAELQDALNYGYKRAK